MKYYLGFIFTSLVLSSINLYAISNDCIDQYVFLTQKDAYQFYQDGIERDLRSGRKKVVGNKKDELIKFAKMINDIILKEDANELIKYISRNEFRDYDDYIDGGIISQNIREVFIKSLKNKKGPMYNFLFNRMKNYESSNMPPEGSSDRLDLKSYLSCFKEKLTWEVLYYPQEDRYEVWFSIPNRIIVSFAYFHYFIKIEYGKFVLVGF